MDSQDIHRTQRNLFIFITAVLGLAILACVISPQTISPETEPGISELHRLLWLLAPLGVMLLLRSFGGDGWDDFGLPSTIKGIGLWWLTSILIFPIILTIFVLVCSLFCGLQIDGKTLPDILAAVVTGLAAALIKIIFEEFAWRGYLAPRVYSLNLNIWLSHAIVGLVWGVWHLPFVFALWPYLTTEMLWYFVPLLLIGTISQNIVYNEIRLASASNTPSLEHAQNWRRQHKLPYSQRISPTRSWKGIVMLSRDRDTFRHVPHVYRGFLAASTKDEFVTSDQLNSSW
jgi:hypothetical protein